MFEPKAISLIIFVLAYILCMFLTPKRTVIAIVGASANIVACGLLKERRIRSYI